MGKAGRAGGESGVVIARQSDRLGLDPMAINLLIVSRSETGADLVRGFGGLELIGGGSTPPPLALPSPRHGEAPRPGPVPGSRGPSLGGVRGRGDLASWNFDDDVMTKRMEAVSARALTCC